MFASLAFFLAAQGISIPLGKPPRIIEQARAPIESAGPRWAAACDGSQDWEKPAPPVRIHANTYYVGTCGISSILIVGNAGDILIDGGPEGAADIIAHNIRELGFSLRDIRIILNSHEHFDHAGGIARLQHTRPPHPAGRARPRPAPPAPPRPAGGRAPGRPPRARAPGGAGGAPPPGPPPRRGGPPPPPPRPPPPASAARPPGGPAPPC